MSGEVKYSIFIQILMDSNDIHFHPFCIKRFNLIKQYSSKKIQVSVMKFSTILDSYTIQTLALFEIMCNIFTFIKILDGKYFFIYT